MSSQPPLFDHGELHVLLVEDNPGDAKLIERHLWRDGYRQVETVGTLHQALEALRRDARPDVILCDLYLPDGEGPGNVAALRALDGSVPIVVLTGHGSHARGVESLAAGADEFHAKKDLGHISLHRVLRFAIERHRLQAQMHSVVWDNAEPMMVLEPDGAVLFANRRAARLLGDGDASSLVGSRLDLPMLSGWRELCFVRAEGPPLELEVRTSPGSWHGRFAVLAIVRDVSELRALERSKDAARRAAEESDSRLKLVLSQLPIGLWTADAELCVRSYHGDSAIGPALEDGGDATPVQRASPHAAVLEAHREALVRGSASFEYQQDGRAVEGVVHRLSAGVEAQDISLLGFAIEVTRRKELEGQLLQAQKMDAVGRLAGGVAHDFNNLLTAILSFSHFALENLGEEHSAARDIHQILRCADQAATMTRQLLSFSRRHTFHPRVVDLAESIDSAQRLLRRLLSADVALEVRVDEALWPVELDPAAFEQVLVNLAVNARDAMPQGGTLTVRASNADSPGRTAGTAGDAGTPGQHVQVTVSDTGCGMPAHLVERVFEPFFTTKPEGEGTGLGLSMVYNIVEGSGGTIRIESRLGRGTDIHLLWPRTYGAVTRAQVIPAASSSEGHETVLLAEDEAAVRELIQRALEDVGYHVITAADGAEALWRSRAHRGRIDLLVTDLVMPKLSGRSLSARLAASRPDARVLFLSGYGDAQAGVDEGAVLSKPFSPAAIRTAVREALDSGLRLHELPRRQRVLVVDDDDLVLRAADRLLRDQWEVVLANRAASAVKRIEQETFDVVLCDIVMPGMDGSDLHSWARVEYPDVASRFVFLTGALGDRYVDSFLEKSGQPVIPKPMDPQVMRDLVSRTAESA